MPRREEHETEDDEIEEDEELLEEDEENDSQEGDAVKSKKGKGKRKATKGTDNEDDDDEEEEDEENSDKNEKRDVKKGSNTSAAFLDFLPPRKPPAAELQLPIPGMGSGRVRVFVQLSAETPLARRSLSAKPSSGAATEEGEEEEQEEEEEGEEKGVGKGDANTPRCPPWLPHLLNDDTPHWEYVVERMYGHTAEPFAVRFDAFGENNAGGASLNTGNDKDDDEEEEEEEEEVGRRGKSASTGRDMEEGDASLSGLGDTVVGELNSRDGEQLTHRKGKQRVATTNYSELKPNQVFGLHSIQASMHNLPTLTVLRFPEGKRLCFLVRDARSSGEWYLLDALPPRRRRQRTDSSSQGDGEDSENDGNGAKKKRKKAPRDEDEDKDEDEGDEEEDEEDEDEEEKDEDDVDNSHTNDEDDSNTPHFDYSTAIPIDTLMLAALLSPTALRCCLSQREPVSFVCLEEWLRRDLHAALPLLTSIHRTMLSVYATDQPRLPYVLPSTAMDFNIFLTPRFLTLRGAAMHPRVRSSTAVYEGERRGGETLEALLRVGIRPTRHILLCHITSVVAIRLLLWLLMHLPVAVLEAWTKAVPLTAGEGEDGGDHTVNDDDDDDDVEAAENDSDEEDEEDTRGRRRGKMGEVEALLHQTPRGSGPVFVLGPLLRAVTMEIRRRMVRDEDGDEPSQFRLMECLGRALPDRLEDGRRDAIVTEAFSLLPPDECVRNSFCSGAVYGGSANATTTVSVVKNCISVMSNVSSCSTPPAAPPRRQRLYQSDLVLLLLALTTTPVRRSQLPLLSPMKPSMPHPHYFLKEPHPLLPVNGIGVVPTAVPVRPPSAPSTVPATTKMTAKEVIERRKTTVTVRPARPPLASSLADAHYELFSFLFRKKCNRPRTPVEAARAGYMRLLFMCLPRFRNTCSTRLVLTQAPLYTLFGPHDICPLGDIVHAWALDRGGDDGGLCGGSGSGSSSSCGTPGDHVNLFVDNFWAELHQRFTEKQYDDATLARARILMMPDKVQERRRAFLHVLRQLETRRRSPAVTPKKPLHAGASSIAAFPSQISLVESVYSSFRGQSGVCGVIPNMNAPASLSLRAAGADAMAATALNDMGEECRVEEERVRLLFDSLPMAPRSYSTPETLHALLFEVKIHNPYAVRHFMLRRGVVTVRCDALREKPVAAMEAAVRRGDWRAVQVLLLVGDTLGIPMDGGRDRADAWLSEAAAPAEADKLLRRWHMREEQRAIDPRVDYGILNTVPSAP